MDAGKPTIEEGDKLDALVGNMRSYPTVTVRRHLPQPNVPLIFTTLSLFLFFLRLTGYRKTRRIDSAGTDRYS